jgi:hypothetical protein
MKGWNSWLAACCPCAEKQFNSLKKSNIAQICYQMPVHFNVMDRGLDLIGDFDGSYHYHNR